MSEREYDKMLCIKTTGLREWKDGTIHYNRYEPTPYKALDHFFETYKVNKNDKIVDFGSGRGRVAFYIHNRFEIPVTGVEVNDITYEEAIDNKMRYRQRAKHITAPIQFKYALAENYKVKSQDNTFYFFNPFSIEIFKKVVHNILKSVKKEKRPVDIILYYPMPEYKKFLRKKTPFQLINKVKIPKAIDSREKFLIYRCG